MTLDDLILGKVLNEETSKCWLKNSDLSKNFQPCVLIWLHLRKGGVALLFQIWEYGVEFGHTLLNVRFTKSPFKDVYKLLSKKWCSDRALQSEKYLNWIS